MANDQRKYPHLPECKCGNGGKLLEKDHDWWVNNPEYDNCFWVYLRHNAHPHTLSQIADLLGLSISAITATEKRAQQKFMRRYERMEKEGNKKA